MEVGVVKDGVGQEGGKTRGIDGFEIPESYRALLLDLWCGDENVHGDSQVVRDSDIEAGQIADCDAGDADKVQCVSFFMVWKINMLDEVEDVYDVQKFFRGFGVDSTCMLKSQSSRIDGVMAQSFDRSDKKAELGLGGGDK